jgi:hypothetical protein
MRTLTGIIFIAQSLKSELHMHTRYKRIPKSLTALAG